MSECRGDGYCEMLLEKNADLQQRLIVAEGLLRKTLKTRHADENYYYDTMEEIEKYLKVVGK